MEFKALGTQGNQFAGLETFPNPGVSDVTFYTEEFTSVCPVTGQPDFASVHIMYQPDQLCVESKTLKLYLQSYRNQAAFMEKVAVTIKDDLVQAIQPISLFVSVASKPRGGLALTATASFSKENGGSPNAIQETPVTTGVPANPHISKDFLRSLEEVITGDYNSPNPYFSQEELAAMDEEED